jgi:uncharacterized protein (DUF2164 family)
MAEGFFPVEPSGDGYLENMGVYWHDIGEGRTTMVDKSKIKMTREKREEMVDDIKNYFKKERGEEMGQLASGLMLDFIIEKLAPEFYNQGVMDSYRFLSNHLEDVQSLLI